MKKEELIEELSKKYSTSKEGVSIVIETKLYGKIKFNPESDNINFLDKKERFSLGSKWIQKHLLNNE